MGAVQFDLIGLLTFAGTTGIISAVLTTGLSWLADSRKSKSSAAHLALQLAVALEGFFMTCGERYARLDLQGRSGGNAGGRTVEIPVAPAFPSDDGAWRALARKLRNRAMGFANEVTSGKQYVAFMDDAAHDPSGEDFQRHVRLQVVHLAVEAYDLASDLRKTYRWEPAEIAGNGIAYMRDELERLHRLEDVANAATTNPAETDTVGPERDNSSQRPEY